MADNFEETTLLELNTPLNYGVNIVLIKRDGKEFMPKAGDVIKAKDEIFAFGTKENAKKLAEKLIK